ncbi:hypothetical protein MNBD_GAMMA08-2235 [hydrothermal vent metagenome]|uniref:N-acetyltransferase domain-containing protein n=1 Tax=hydrothermal vent metagenome TaxID=652676 RepID=A0A3B0Y6I5_9ZZZZ
MSFLAGLPSGYLYRYMAQEIMKINLNPSKIENTEEIVTLLKRSIIEICGPDYDNSKTILNNWLVNKTPENLTKWIKDKNNISVSAIVDEKIVGFCMANVNGEILLLYVLPNNICEGIGRSMYLYIENILKAKNVKIVTAFSTITAAPFYNHMGFNRNEDSKELDEMNGEVKFEKSIAI